MYRYIFFDLDGTLTDSKAGIFNSLSNAFTQMGLPVPPESVLRRFIGPPLPESFREFCGFDDAQIQQGMALFRQRYDTTGKFENTPAPGMLALCQDLRQKGYILSLASSKPEAMCHDICHKFGFADHLHEIVGSSINEDWTKTDVIREAMGRLNIAPHQANEILMVGDRKFDVLGAKALGIDCIGVELFGYAQPGELLEAGAIAVVDSVDALAQWIDQQI